MAFTNDFSYSISKEKALDTCPRMLWYQSYGFWKGWWYNGPPSDLRAAEIYQAKYFQNKFTWPGVIVHDAAKWALREAKRGTTYDVNLRDKLMTRASLAIDIGISQALERRATNPKHTVRLIEVEKGEELDEAYIRERVEDRIVSLTSIDDTWTGTGTPMNLFTRAIKHRKSIVSVEDMVQFTHNGIKVFLVIDLLMRSKGDPQRQCTIIDWKTGKPDFNDKRQIGLYGTWAHTRNWQGARMMLVYLSEGGATTHQSQISDSDIRYAKERISRYALNMRDRLKNGSHRDNVAIEDKFEPTTKTRNCNRCSFQLICARDGTKPTRLDYNNR